MSDQVTEALERLRSDGDVWQAVDGYGISASAIKDKIGDWLLARDFALAATDGRPLTREWLAELLGEATRDHPNSPSYWGKGGCGRVYFDGPGAWLEMPNSDEDKYATTRCEVLDFFRFVGWPVSRAKIVEAWRAL